MVKRALNLGYDKSLRLCESSDLNYYSRLQLVEEIIAESIPKIKEFVN